VSALTEVTEVVKEAREIWTINVHIRGQSFAISCGDDPPQLISWLGHVAIARTDDAKFQGWRKYGIPKEIRHGGVEGPPLDLDAVIGKTLVPGDHVYVIPSQDGTDPNE
jgi:hypothetical protein